MIGELAALGASCCWAVGSHLFGRIARSGEVPPGAMNLGKCAAATVLFGLTALGAFALGGHGVSTASPRAYAWLLASGFVGLALGDSAYFHCIVRIGVRRGLLLLSTAPVFAAAGGALFLGEQLGLRQWVAILVVMIGVAVVVEERDAGRPAGTPQPLTSAGLLFGVLAGLGQAAGSLMSRAGMREGLPALDAALVRLSAGVVGIVVLAALSQRLGGYTRALRLPGVGRAIAGTAAIGTYLGIWLSQLAIGRAQSTAVASTLLAMSPIFALPLGKWLNDDRVSARAIGGTLVAFAGLVLLRWGRN